MRTWGVGFFFVSGILLFFFVSKKESRVISPLFKCLFDMGSGSISLVGVEILMANVEFKTINESLEKLLNQTIIQGKKKTFVSDTISDDRVIDLRVV